MARVYTCATCGAHADDQEQAREHEHNEFRVELPQTETPEGDRPEPPEPVVEPEEHHESHDLSVPGSEGDTPAEETGDAAEAVEHAAAAVATDIAEGGDERAAEQVVAEVEEHTQAAAEELHEAAEVVVEASHEENVEPAVQAEAETAAVAAEEAVAATEGKTEPGPDTPPETAHWFYKDLTKKR